jgi:hypothetical protein
MSLIDLSLDLNDRFYPTKLTLIIDSICTTKLTLINDSSSTTKQPARPPNIAHYFPLAVVVATVQQLPKTLSLSIHIEI